MTSFLHGRNFLVIGSILALLLSVACGGGPKVNKESPDYHYSDVKKAMAEIKYEKAISLTSEVQSKFPGTEYADKARLLRIILLSGLSEGYRSLAEANIAGQEKSLKNSGQFRSIAFDYYRKQKSAALGMYEGGDYFLKNFSDKNPYVLDCDFPSKDVTVNRGLDEIRAGKMLDAERIKTVEETELQNQVLLTLSGFVGAGDDRVKARKLLESGSATLDHPQFMVTLGRSLLDNQKIFGRMALNDPQNYRQFFQKAKEFSDLAQKLLKDKPNKETQERADRLKADIVALEKKAAR